MVLPVVLSKAIARNLLRLIRQSRTSMRSPLNVPAWAWAGVATYQAYQAMVPGVQYIGAAVRLVLRVPRWMWSILVKAWQQAPDEATAGTPKPDRTNGDVAIAASPCDGLSPSEWLVPGVFVRTKVCAARLVVASEVTTDGEGVKGVFTLPWPHGAAASLPGEAPVFQPRAVLVPAEQADVSAFDASFGFASPVVASTPVRTPRDGVPPHMSKLTSSVSSRATPWCTLEPLSCIVGHMHRHRTCMQPAEAGSTHVSTLLIKHPPNLGFWPAVQSASSAMGTPSQMRNAAGAAPRATAVPGNGPRQQDQRRGEQQCGVMLCVVPVPMQVLPHASLASHGERQLHARTAMKPAGGVAQWRLWSTSGSLPNGEWSRAVGGALHVQS